MHATDKEEKQNLALCIMHLTKDSSYSLDSAITNSHFLISLPLQLDIVNLNGNRLQK